VKIVLITQFLSRLFICRIGQRPLSEVSVIPRLKVLVLTVQMDPQRLISGK